MLKVWLEAKSRESQPQLQRGGKGEPSAEARARHLHPAMTVEGRLAAGSAVAAMRTPASHHSSFPEEFLLIWLFKPGLSVPGEMNHPEEEGLICQGFIATALQLHGGDGGLEAGVEGAGEGTGRAVSGLSPAALGAAEAAWHLPACSSPEGLPMWAAAWAGICRCELYAEHFHPCQFLCRGSQGEEYGLLLPLSFALCIWRGNIIFMLLPVCPVCQDLWGK